MATSLQTRHLCVGATMLALCSCVHRVECTAHGGSEWNEVQTAHFSVQSDIPIEEAKAAANEFEKLRAAIRWYFGLGDEGEEMTRVLLVAHTDEISEFKADWVNGFAFSNGIESTIVTTPPDDTATTAQFSTMAHELSHRIAPLTLLRMSTWLNEGLATYFESVRLLPNRQAKVGLVGLRIYAFRDEQPLPLQELVTFEPNAPNLDSNQIKVGYASAWAWVHFLTNTRTARWQAFLNRLRRAEAPDAAFEAEFPRGTWPELERGLRDYLEHARYGSSVLQLAKTSTVQRSRRLEPWEVHLLRRSLWELSDLKDAAQRTAHVKAESEAARALAVEPVPWPVARALAEDRKSLIETARQYPGEADALLVLANAESSCATQLPYLRQAQQLSPRHPAVLRFLAHCLAGFGDVESQVLFERSRSQMPWVPMIEVTHAKLASKQGRCEEIEPALNQALALLADTGTGAMRGRIELSRADYLAECRSTPGLTCADALRTAASAKTAEQLSRAAAACSQVFSQPACAEAWRATTSVAPAERAAKLTEACAAAYCPSLPEPRPAACSEKNLSRDDRADLQLEILGQELRIPGARAVFEALDQVERSGQPLAIGGGDDAPLVWQLERGLAPNAVRQVLEDLKAPQCAPEKFFGHVITRLNVGGDGHVVSAKVVARRQRNDAFEACLLAKLRAAVFPPPADRAPLTVTYPFSISLE